MLSFIKFYKIFNLKNDRNPTNGFALLLDSFCRRFWVVFESFLGRFESFLTHF